MNRVFKFSLRIIVACIILIILCGLRTSFLPKTHAQCSVPGQVTGVSITYPNCVSGNCNFAQGSCAWVAVTGATTYNVTISAVETSTTILTQSVTSPTVSLAFPVATSSTYKCDVAAVNSCGTGTVGTSSLLCRVDAVASPSPTIAPTVAPTATPTVTPSIAPVIESPGSNILSILGFSGLILIAISFSLLLL
jgi:hypothetical protein